jgi:hypothetical protein
MTDISNSDDTIDSRDIIERIDELTSSRDEDASDEDASDELALLESLQDEIKGYSPDWTHGETLIRDSYFVEYAEQLAGDTGAIDSDARWPACHIDWEAAADSLKMDYMSVEYDGVDYWMRCG